MNKLRMDTTGKGTRILNRKGLVAAEHGMSAEAGRGWKTLVFDEDTPASTDMAFMPTSAPLRDLWWHRGGFGDDDRETGVVIRNEEDRQKDVQAAGEGNEGQGPC
jgi:hypothetical protein